MLTIFAASCCANVHYDYSPNPILTELVVALPFQPLLITDQVTIQSKQIWCFS